jgi:hypothetical protein
MRRKYFPNWMAGGSVALATAGLLVLVGGGQADDKKEAAANTEAATVEKADDKKADDKKADDKKADDKKAADKDPAKKNGDSRPLKTSTVMKFVTKPHCDALKKIFEKGPKTSEDWDALIEHSEVLSEVSFILMEDGRCPDYVWEGAATQTLRNCAKAIIAASERRNVVVAQGAFEKLTESCTSCHDAHKEKTSLLELVE